MTVIWSDILAYNWDREWKQEDKNEKKTLGEQVDIFPFPLTGNDGRSSIEGWIMGMPAYLLEDKNLIERAKFAAGIVDWFLSPQIQIRYAEVGGNTARRDVGSGLGYVNRQVHRTLLTPIKNPAPKITFQEAPAVILRIQSQISTWVKYIIDNSNQLPTEENIKEDLDKLAKGITSELLHNKTRYRSFLYWKENQERV